MEKGAEAYEGSEVSPNYDPVDTAISIVPEIKQVGNAVASPKLEPPISIAVEQNAITVEHSKLELAVEPGKKKWVEVGHNIEATAQNPEKDTTLEKEKNNVLKPQGAEPNHVEHLQLCSPVEGDAEHPQVLHQENNEVNAGNTPVCPKPESAFPVIHEKRKEAEPSEPYAEHTQPQPCSKQDPAPPGDQTTPIQLSRRQRNRKRRKGIICSEEKVENQMNPLQCSLNQIQPHPAIPVDQENNEGAEPPQLNVGNPPVSYKPKSALLVILKKKKEAEPNEPNAERPQPQPCSKQDPTPPGDQTTPIQLRRRQRNRRRRKGITCSEEKVENQMNLLQCSVNQIQPHPAFPVDQENNEEAEPPQVKARNPPVCPKPESALPVNLEKKEEAEPNEPHAEHPQPQPCSKPDPAPPGDPTTLIQLSRRQRNRRRRKGIMCSEEKVESPMNPLQCSLNRIQPHPAIPKCPKPVETIIDQTIPVSPAIPIDTKQKTMEKERKSTLDGVESNERNTEPPETLIQTAISPIAAPPIGPAIPTDPQQKMTKKKRKRGRKSALKSEEEKPDKNNGKPNETPVLRSMCPIAVTPIDPTIPIIPIDPATPIDPELKMTKKTRKRKRKSAVKSEGEEPNKPQETPVQRSICPIAATPIDPNKPQETPVQRSICPIAATPIDPNKPQETAVQRSICPITATPIDPTIPMDQTIPINPATPIDPEQKMTKKRRKKKMKSAPKSQGTDPDEHNAEPKVETPLLRIKGLTVSKVSFKWPTETSMRKDEATPAETWVQRTKGLKVIKVPFKQHGETSMRKDEATPAETWVQRTKGLKVIEVPFKQHGETSMRKGEATPSPAKTWVERTKGLKVIEGPFKQHGESSMRKDKATPAKTLVERTKGLQVIEVPFKQHGESSMRKGKATSAKTRVQRTKGPKVIEVPFKQQGKSSMICRACQQPGHKFEGCPRLKCLSMDEEICFFCGEIGHSLGKCSVSKAGGGRFAKCLFCYEQGHFSNNCPRNGHGIDPKAVPAIGPIFKTVETEEKSVAEVTAI